MRAQTNWVPRPGNMVLQWFYITVIPPLEPHTILATLKVGLSAMSHNYHSDH